MKAVVLTEPNKWEIQEIETPKLKKGEVLVKMAYAPLNPSDLAFLTGQYGIKKGYPIVPGLEGSGVVESSGGGFMANRLVGKRVSCTAPNTGNGTWAEYMVTDFSKCMALPNSVSLAQGSMLFVNPLTALSFVSSAKANGSQLIVLSAAASALAKMILYFAHKENIPVCGLVRHQHQIEELEKAGFHKVINSTSDTFKQDLANYAKGRKNVRFYDAISGGAMPYQALNALPDNSKLIIYGRLDQSPAEFVPQDLLFKTQTVEGYWLSKEIQKKSILGILGDVRKVQSMLKSGFETNINKDIAIEDINEGLKMYFENMSAGKVLLKF